MNKRGQSIIEYVLIVVLVIFGIVIMGPYVLRSVNAHFKLWDDSVHDSFSEKLTQAPVKDVPFISTNCSCLVNSGSCGSSLPGSLCSAGQREYDYACNPQGCNGAAGNSYCQSDNTCCTGWVNTGCGTIPLGQPATSTNCNYGQEIQRHPCGTDNSIQCISDTADCPAPSCLGILSTCSGNHDVPCPGADDNLDKNYGITYVTDVGSCSGKKCQYMTSCCNWQGWGSAICNGSNGCTSIGPGFTWENPLTPGREAPTYASYCNNGVIQCSKVPITLWGAKAGDQTNMAGLDACPSWTIEVPYEFDNQNSKHSGSNIYNAYACLPAQCPIADTCTGTGWTNFNWPQGTTDFTTLPSSAQYCQNNTVLCSFDSTSNNAVGLNWTGSSSCTCGRGGVTSCPAGTTAVTYYNDSTTASCCGSNNQEWQICLPTQCPTPPSSTSPGDG